MCTATLYYRTTPPGALNPDGFSSDSMTVSRIAGPGVDAIGIDGMIPAGVVDSRAVDYFFSITDGTTTSWWPGSSAADGPGVWLNGTRVVYQHVRILESPKLAHIPSTIAQPLSPLRIHAELTCATVLSYSCSVDIHIAVVRYVTTTILHRLPICFSGARTKEWVTLVNRRATVRLRLDDSYVRPTWQARLRTGSPAGNLLSDTRGGSPDARPGQSESGLSFVVKGRDGRIQRRDSYGNDPARTRG